MANLNDSLYCRIHGLAVGLLEGTLTAAERCELESLLLEDPLARRAYLDHMQDSACLSWLCVDDTAEGVHSVAPSPVAKAGVWNWGRVRLGIAGLLASILVFVAAYRTLDRRQNQQLAIHAGAPKSVAKPQDELPKPTTPEVMADAAARPVATITAAVNAQWERPTATANVLSRWGVGDRLKLKSGSAELTFDAGAQVTMFGPAEFEITSPTSIRCIRGRITTLVDKRGRGFSIETPRAKVVDLGTQFGLSISEKGETEVVVFQGSVDLSAKPVVGDAAPRRMQQGEAVLLKNSGEFERVMRRRKMWPWS